MTVLRESPLFQEILDEGIEQGIALGDFKGQRKAIIAVLMARFTISLEVEAILPQKLERIQTHEHLASLVTIAAQSSDLDAFMKALDKFARPDAD